jgi:hypothetical protein
LSGGDNQGGYGIVHMVQIDHIPNTIKLTKKTPKMDDKREAHKTMISESFGMPLKHPGVIKFLAIHTKTMEAYTLWWNGGLFKKC